ncbi:MAG: hypothetical protein GY851_01955, partial [bacterium]|nr:hypothetical protein [bacterium]
MTPCVGHANDICTNRVTVNVVLLLVLAVLPLASHADLLTNGGFNAGPADLGVWAGTGWTPTANVGREVWAARSGAYGVYFHWWAVGDRSGLLYQDVPAAVAPGAT